MLIGKIKKSQRDLIALETMRIRSRKNAESRVNNKSMDIACVDNSAWATDAGRPVASEARKFTDSKVLYGLGCNVDILHDDF